MLLAGLLGAIKGAGAIIVYRCAQRGDFCRSLLVFLAGAAIWAADLCAFEVFNLRGFLRAREAYGREDLVKPGFD